MLNFALPRSLQTPGLISFEEDLPHDDFVQLAASQDDLVASNALRILTLNAATISTAEQTRLAKLAADKLALHASATKRCVSSGSAS